MGWSALPRNSSQLAPHSVTQPWFRNMTSICSKWRSKWTLLLLWHTCLSYPISNLTSSYSNPPTLLRWFIFATWRATTFWQWKTINEIYHKNRLINGNYMGVGFELLSFYNPRGVAEILAHRAARPPWWLMIPCTCEFIIYKPSSVAGNKLNPDNSHHRRFIAVFLLLVLVLSRAHSPLAPRQNLRWILDQTLAFHK